MGSVHELAPSAAAAKAEVGSATYRIRGLTSDETVCALKEAPGLAGLLGGIVPDSGLFLDGIRVIKPLIEIGCVDEEERVRALKLPLQHQMQLAGDIIKQTFPDETGPFGVMAHALLGMLQVVNLPTTSQEPLSATSGN